MSWTAAILHLFSQETDLLLKVIMKCVNIKLWDILGCFHYILNAPRILVTKIRLPPILRPRRIRLHAFVTSFKRKNDVTPSNAMNDVVY